MDIGDDNNIPIGEMMNTETVECNKPQDGKNNRKKIMTALNQWDSKSLLEARTSDDGEVVLCKISKKELFYVRSEGTTVMLSAYGKCEGCREYFSDSHLFQHEGVDKVSWPVEYSGRFCKPCWAKD